MERQIATTTEQGDRLLRCGVSADTADMMWSRLDETRVHSLYAIPWYTPRLPNRKITDNDFPAWSLSALMTKILPSNIRYEGHTSLLEITSSNWQSDEQIWEVAYDIDLGVEAPDPIEACVLMVEKLVANGYNLNEQ